jgi:hypothetical protein
MIVQEVVRRLCASYRYWHFWPTIALLRHTGGSNLNIFLGTTDDAAEGDASQAPFMEEEVRR